jgi:hypothetical protein
MAEPIKLWSAKIGYERMQEMADPSSSLQTRDGKPIEKLLR